MDVKEPKTYEEQLDILIRRGCIIQDKATAVNILQRSNYYRLSAYFLPFKESDDTYKEGTSLEKVYKIYEFDRRITMLLYGLIEEIEVFVKTQIAYYHSIKYGALGYTDSDNFPASKSEKHKELIDLFYKEVHNNKEVPFVKHHIKQYDSKFPFWAAVELFTLGNTSQFYSQMNTSDKKVVCANITELTGYTYTFKQMESLLFCLTSLRNKCAHFSRIYYYKFGTIPKFPPYVTKNVCISPDNLRLFQYLFILKLLTPDHNRWNNFTIELETLIDEYSEYISLEHIGFPDNWRSELMSDMNLKESNPVSENK